MTSEEAAAAAPKVFQLLGRSLLGHNGAQVALSSITGPGKVIALYFSSHWCPPCRQFTPHLATIYRAFKEAHAQKADWEVVFVSSDHSAAEFRDYFAEMPWAALPYDKRDAKTDLSAMYNVRGIPSLVLVDGETGELITANGRGVVGGDPQCVNFPWKPMSFKQIMDGAMLVEPKTGSEVGALGLLRGKVTLLYFSASWCPPCRRFTPKLVEAMEKLRAGGKAVEAIFVSCDRNEKSMKEYHSHMTWPAVAWTDRGRITELETRFEVASIPRVVVLDEQFMVVTNEGVQAVAADTAGKHFPWHTLPPLPHRSGCGCCIS